ncbi:hypothetical protein BJY52DRAFT_1245376 [Lactarius psammicola]|nr:hypothetical protein BJY52DRAFT_1245376 [Lactarius psammicola]
MYSSNNKPAVRHKVYFFPDGDITIRVEDSTFRVHRYFLIRESIYFQSMLVGTIPCLDPPGSSETNPVVLKDATSEGFADLIWVLYKPQYSTYSATLDKWKRILTLAQQWSFIQVEELCVKELEKLTIPPVEKIQIYQDFNLNPDLLYDSYVALTIRTEPLDLEEGNKLELSTSLKITRARELARSPQADGATSFFGPATPRLEESEIQSVIRDIFGLQGSTSAQVTNYSA